MKKTIVLILMQCLALALTGRAASENGAASQMPAYYDHQLFTINFMELPSGGENAAQQHNRSINFIYMSDAGLPGGQPFVATSPSKSLSKAIIALAEALAPGTPAAGKKRAGARWFSFIQ